MAHLLNRLDITDAQLLKALELITVRTGERMMEHGKHAHASKHESMGIIAEEYYEMVEAVRKDDTKEFVDEVMDIIVAGVWTLASVIAGSEANQAPVSPPTVDPDIKPIFVPPTAKNKK